MNFVIDRFIQTRKQDQSLTEANLQRLSTVANVLKRLKLVLIYTINILWLLQWLNLIPGSVLLLSAVLALAASFTAQSLVKDFVNGFLILFEVQFRIGDNVKIGMLSGVVENLSLRVTQIRNNEGDLITLPNNLITQVQNQSRLWARANVCIEVAYHTDVDRALAIVQETVDQMARDPEWQSIILDTQELLGVEQISHTGIMIRIWIKTTPQNQWETARELRRRLKIAFDRHYILIGTPQQICFETGFNTLSRIEEILLEKTEVHH